ncbi:hypothetical protein ACSDQ9_12690 [Aestuariimicrobium soli]|uniref:hypothetical protein n=1 Tax=Aestuariimicrobium soli TaxID=2035834 RepID=UPI003EBB133E
MLYWLMGLGVVALCALLLVTHLHDRAETKALASSHHEVDELRRACEDDVALLGADVRRHAPLDDLGELTDDAWRQARDLQGRARDLLRQATSPHQFEQVTAHLAQARQCLADVQALVLDDEAPEARPCCFFNPNHGPADTTTEWPTATGTVTLPCCEADARRVASGADPYARTWPVGDDRVVWWLAGEAAQPWARGWFGAWRGTPPWQAMSRVAPVLEPALQTDAA